jgi:2-polyprenyl-6-methoxyphenol hydroxylase-like FAD-dependent oxidoreductase
MARILVAGGGVCGLGAAIMLGRDGHDVVVLERDDAPVPTSPQDAWDEWAREGVAQFHQPHYLHPSCRAVLDEELPEVRDALVAAGAAEFDVLWLMPPSIADRRPRPGDDRFVTITARRPVLEHAVAQVAAGEPTVDVRRGVPVAELVTRTFNGIPHVTGVRTQSGERMEADLVVDATGRSSRLPQWLAQAGAEAPWEEGGDSGFIYYTRYFAARDGSGRPPLRSALNAPIGSFSILALPGDNDTWSLTLYTSTGDQPLKNLRHEDRWTAVVRACPMHAHLLEGQPIGGVIAMGGIEDRRRRLVADGKPVVTGLAAVADAWACTNPSMGRGITLGLLHARCLRDVVRAGIEDPRAFAEQWDAVTEEALTPWYRDTVDADQARLREIEALRRGEAPPPPTSPAELLRAALPVAVLHDADVFRAMLEARCMITPAREVFARPGLAERVMALAQEHERPPLPGPDRERLLELLA